jgi:hypothetical protein
VQQAGVEQLGEEDPGRAREVFGHWLDRWVHRVALRAASRGVRHDRLDARDYINALNRIRALPTTR